MKQEDEIKIQIRVKIAITETIYVLWDFLNQEGKDKALNLLISQVSENFNGIRKGE